MLLTIPITNNTIKFKIVLSLFNKTINDDTAIKIAFAQSHKYISFTLLNLSLNTPPNNEKTTKVINYFKF